MSKLINCKTCNAEIAASAKLCPGCGAKNKKPFYTKWWVWVIAIVIIAAIGNQGKGNQAQQVNSDSSSPPPKAVVADKKEAEPKPEVTPEPKPEATPEPKKEKKPDFEIVGDITSENDGFALYIKGTIKNNKGRDLSYAQVTFNLYDEEGNQVGTALDNINNLEKDGTWKFKAIGLETEATSYKLVEITGF